MFRVLVVLPMLLTAGFFLQAKEPLPEIVARCGRFEVSREQAGKLLQAGSAGNPAENTSLLDFRALLKKRLTEYFCTENLKSRLTEEGFPLSAEIAEAELKKLYAAYPAGYPRPSEGDIHRISGEEFTQLQWSFRRYLMARHPEILLVPDIAVERYYREHQQKFMRPRSLVLRVYQAPDPGRLNLLQLRIRQGIPAEKVLKDLTDVTQSVQFCPVPAGEVMRIGEWSAPERTGTGWRITCVEAEHPAGYVTLQNAAPMIREILVRKLAAAELQKRLSQVLAEQKMEFYF